MRLTPKRTFLTRFYLLSFLIIGLVCTSLTRAEISAPTIDPLQPAPPKIAAESYVLMDAKSKSVILEKNAHLKLPPASLTKIMTSYIVAHELELGNIHHGDMVPVSISAWEKPGSKMFIREGTQVLLSDLIQGMIVQSGNDASIALAEYIAGSESAFADLMNRHALNIGMQGTHFKNATGWPSEDHVSTAYDLALLTQALIRRFPEHYKYYSQKSFTYNEITQKNRNILLSRDPSVDGVKTGFTADAGYCLVTSSSKKDMRLITVLMGTSSPRSRANESQKLLAYGYRFYKTHQAFFEGQILKTPNVWMGRTNQVDLAAANDVLLTLARSQIDNIKTELDFPKIIKAPIEMGQVLGKVRVVLDGETLQETDLIAAKEVVRAGFFKRLWHHIKLLFQ